jgi:poly-gamma-glutamate capsule biosynthesis protein CapA/YwtB (metallophosphatase superfamily)
LRKGLLFILTCICILIIPTIARAIPVTPEKSSPDEILKRWIIPTGNNLLPKGFIRISFAGDCTLGTDESFPYAYSFPYQLKKNNNDFSYFFAKVKPIFEKDDLTLVNLETTFTKATKKAVKTFRFKGDPSYVNILREGAVEMVNISNNHIYDYLEAGFRDTLSALEKGGILYSGEGYIAYYQAKGITIASLGYNGWNTSIRKSLEADIEEAREKADIVIVSFHWGKEHSFYPNAVQKELGRFSIDQGADVVVGHHPHVIQGIEKYKDRYIVYSLGNFCFGGNRNPSDKDTFIFQNDFIVESGRVRRSNGRVIPCRISSFKHINDYQPTPLEGKEAVRVLNRIYTYSGSLEYGIREIEEGKP